MEHLDWGTPIIAVLKGDKSVRICCGFNATVNPVFKLDRYLDRVLVSNPEEREDLYPYQQIPLTTYQWSSRQFVCIASFGPIMAPRFDKLQKACLVLELELGATREWDYA